MPRPYLIIVCGVPGAGKSTLALHLSERWGATCFASETFAAELGPAARGPSGDLTREAIAHAYAAMGRAADEALRSGALVVAVGSFRAADQRKRFRDIAAEAGAGAATLRVTCPVGVAAARVRARIALGEHGPTEGTLRGIDTELSHAADIDLEIRNEAALERLHESADAAMRALALQA